MLSNFPKHVRNVFLIDDYNGADDNFVTEHDANLSYIKKQGVDTVNSILSFLKDTTFNNIILNTNATIDNINKTTFNYLYGVTSNIQTQFNTISNKLNTYGGRFFDIDLSINNLNDDLNTINTNIDLHETHLESIDSSYNSLNEIVNIHDVQITAFDVSLNELIYNVNIYADQNMSNQTINELNNSIISGINTNINTINSSLANVVSTTWNITSETNRIIASDVSQNLIINDIISDISNNVLHLSQLDISTNLINTHLLVTDASCNLNASNINTINTNITTLQNKNVNIDASINILRTDLSNNIAHLNVTDSSYNLLLNRLNNSDTSGNNFNNQINALNVTDISHNIRLDDAEARLTLVDASGVIYNNRLNVHDVSLNNVRNFSYVDTVDVVNQTNISGTLNSSWLMQCKDISFNGLINNTISSLELECLNGMYENIHQKTNNTNINVSNNTNSINTLNTNMTSNSTSISALNQLTSGFTYNDALQKYNYVGAIACGALTSPTIDSLQNNINAKISAVDSNLTGNTTITNTNTNTINFNNVNANLTIGSNQTNTPIVIGSGVYALNIYSNGSVYWQNNIAGVTMYLNNNGTNTIINGGIFPLYKSCPSLLAFFGYNSGALDINKGVSGNAVGYYVGDNNTMITSAFDNSDWMFEIKKGYGIIAYADPWYGSTVLLNYQNTLDTYDHVFIRASTVGQISSIAIYFNGQLISHLL